LEELANESNDEAGKFTRGKTLPTRLMNVTWNVFEVYDRQICTEFGPGNFLF
jgi:hypothetical protein